MSIEPIGTMTSVQVQSTTKITKPAENMDVSTQPQTNSVDAVTAAIAKVSNSANQEGQEGTQGGSNESARQAAYTYNKLTENTKAVFGVNEATNRITIKIVDKDTDEIIKEFPAEKTLDMIARVWEMAGLMVDEKR